MPVGYDALLLEDGTVTKPPKRAADLPIGVHALIDSAGEPAADIAVVPNSLARPQRSWAWTIFPCVMRSKSSWGVGDFHDLTTLAQWCSTVDAQYLFLGPTNAGRVTVPLLQSPYSPSSRLFQNPIYLFPPAISGWPELADGLRRHYEAARELNESVYIDLDAAFAHKLPALRALFDWHLKRKSRHDDLAQSQFTAAMGNELRLFAVYCAIESKFGPAWNSWPAELRDPGTAVRSRWVRRHERLVSFFEWCQWKLDEQLAAAASQGVGLVRDLPVGTPLASADAWIWQDLLASDWELGAPPDYFNPDGHRWGLVPYNWPVLAGHGFRPFQLALRNTLRHAAGIRIDHALGLLRQYWIPAGKTPDAGQYVPQPTVPLLDIICIEAHRSRAFVVTEELGTAPRGGKRAFRKRGFLDYSPVLSDDFDARSPDGVVSGSTHDLPTVAGCWTGLDSRLLTAAGISVDREFAARSRQRLQEYAWADSGADTELVINRLYGSLAASRSAVVVVSMEDALGVCERPNVPGALPPQWPSFSQGLPLLPAILGNPGISRLVTTLRASR